MPSKFSDLDSLVGLTSLQIKGNNTIPGGDFPASLFATGSLTSVDIEYTALQGSFASIDVSQSPTLQSVKLVNNLNLGSSLPDFSKNGKLNTLWVFQSALRSKLMLNRAITGQGITSLDESKLPASLSYLDLSFNSLGGSLPSFSSLTSLSVL